MDDTGRQFALQTLRFRWFTLIGTAFHDLFADVMENAWPGDFQRVKPYGRYGDLKCDGYFRSHKRVFQCYAPVVMKQSEVIAKIRTDLCGAADHWHGRMTHWTFVHNDNAGLTANAVQVLEDLKEEHPTIEISVWTWPQIREQFDKLSSDAMEELFGHPPTANSLDQLDFSELRPVVEQISKREADPLIPLGDPPSSTKIEKNSLDPDSVAFLQMGRRRVRLVEEYFDQHHEPGLCDQIAEAMQVQYQMLADTGFESNEILVKLQQFAGWGRRDGRHDAAVLAVIVYFFDRCDIFEDPSEQDIEIGMAKT